MIKTIQSVEITKQQPYEQYEEHWPGTLKIRGIDIIKNEQFIKANDMFLAMTKVNKEQGLGEIESYPLADPGGGGAAARAPPQQDQFLSFSHTFSPKSVRVGGWRPPTGNPGSATVIHQ